MIDLSLHFLIARMDSLGGDVENARAVRNLLRYRLDAVSPVLSNEALDPRSVKVFRTANKEAIQVDDFCALQAALHGSELRKGAIGLSGVGLPWASIHWIWQTGAIGSPALARSSACDSVRIAMTIPVRLVVVMALRHLAYLYQITVHYSSAIDIVPSIC